jgi:glycerol-3-phosphate dehydrogenase
VLTIDLGMWIYDGLSLFRSPKIHKRLSRKQVAKVEPALRNRDIKGAELYYDCSTDDARLTLETALDAARNGAAVATWCRVEKLCHDDRGRVTGAVVLDRLSGEPFEVAASVVVNATGPWTDRTRRLALGDTTVPLLRPTKGVHLVVSSKRLSVNNAVVMMHPDDGRVLFAIPWGEETYVGTTDTDWEGDPADVAADSDDVDYLLQSINHFFPDSALVREDVISTWAGLRPLITEAGVDESAVSREHRLVMETDGVLTIAGGKLTTYRKMAAEVVDRATDLLRLSGQLPMTLRPANTDREPLPGAVGWPEDDDHGAVASKIREASEGRIDEATSDMLTVSYGMCGIDIARRVAADPELAERLVAGRPEILAQVDWAVERELAGALQDVLMRRTQLYFRDPSQGVDAVDVVVKRMAERLGWDEAEQARQRADFEREVARSQAWRDG